MVRKPRTPGLHPEGGGEGRASATPSAAEGGWGEKGQHPWRREVGSAGASEGGWGWLRVRMRTRRVC